MDNNRLKLYLANEEAPEEEEPYGDFFVITWFPFGCTMITKEMAHRVERLLDGNTVPQWIVFNDRSGSRFRVRSDLIRTLCESTTEQRAADRRYERARKREERADKSWEDDDDD
jgi:hypothetical protein